MGDGGELQFIVDRLNEPPFSMTLTMVAFDEKTPFELLEVVNEVMADLSEQHKVDLRDETPEATATRMLDFLRVLNYKSPHQNLEPEQAKRALLHGDPAMIYPILTWMLQRRPELQKRAYLARFLVNVEVPEHMFTDEEIVEVYQNYKDLQEEFKEVLPRPPSLPLSICPPSPSPSPSPSASLAHAPRLPSSRRRCTRRPRSTSRS